MKNHCIKDRRKYKMIKVILADDDGIIREGLKMILDTQSDIELLAVATNGEEAVKLCRKLQPDVVMLDIRMPIMDGITASEIILKEGIGIPLLLTTFDEEELILKALQVGVSGYILKNSTSERILNGIRSVSVGGAVFQKDILECIQKNIGSSNFNKNNRIELTQRENQIVELIAKGLSNQEIAEQLFLTNGTVRNYISTILEKMNLTHRTQIAVVYLS